MKRSPLRKKSKKQLKIDRELRQVYQEMAETRRPVCTGCGTKQHLTHSHLIPRSRRRDLVADPGNITYHCMNCHKVWESGVQADKLFDFYSNMAYIKSVDQEYYNIRDLKLDKNN